MTARRAALFSALFALAAAAARADDDPVALAASLGVGAASTTRTTNVGNQRDTFVDIEAHVELGARLNEVGALVAIANVGYTPSNNRKYGLMSSLGGGLRIGPQTSRITLGGAITEWDINATTLSGPSLFAHLALPLADRFGLHFQAAGHFLGANSALTLSFGLGFCD
jgi:hypothetical protein